MKYLLHLLTALLLCNLIACNNSADTAIQKLSVANNKDLLKETNKAVDYKTADFNEEAIAADSIVSPQNNNTPKRSAAPGKGETKEDWDKKIVKTGELSIEVKNYKAFNEMLHAGMKQFGGYIAQEEQNQLDYKIENTLTIKVPVDQFDNAVAAFSPATEKITEKKITSEDVTSELVDTKSRMEAKKKVRDRYLDLLKQAKNMDEILQVQNEINEIQENIEAAAGRIDYLGHAAAFSTIHINFYQVLNAALIADHEPSYAHRIAESFSSGLHWFAELFVILVSLWPLWISLIVILFFFRKQKITSLKKKAG